MRDPIRRTTATDLLHHANRWCVVAFAGCLGSCRIYRDDARAHDGQPIPAERERALVSAPPAERSAPSGAASDALNLWVLNRPKGDLPPLTPDPSDPPRAPTTERPAAAVLVVLGAGQAEPCALQFARRASDALANGREPLQIVVSVLHEARRWRWRDPSRTGSAVVRSSAGDFGGVQSAPVDALSPAMLRSALERRAILSGPRPRRKVPPEPALDLGSCDSVPGPGLDGPIGVLVRSARGEFFGGLVSLDPLADAGLVSVAAQYGVSLAVGSRGAVLLVSDCDLPPADAIAERVYASSNWALATAELSTPDACRSGHALLNDRQAWIETGSALGWGKAEIEPAALPAPEPPGRSSESLPVEPDAGAEMPDSAVPR